MSVLCITDPPKGHNPAVLRQQEYMDRLRQLYLHYDQQTARPMAKKAKLTASLSGPAMTAEVKASSSSTKLVLRRAGNPRAVPSSQAKMVVPRTPASSKAGSKAGSGKLRRPQLQVDTQSSALPHTTTQLRSPSVAPSSHGGSGASSPLATMDREMVLQHAQLGLDSRRDSTTMDDQEEATDNDDNDDSDDNDTKMSTAQEARYNEDVLTETSKFLASLTSSQLEELSTGAEATPSALPFAAEQDAPTTAPSPEEGSTIDIEQEIVATLNSLQQQGTAEGIHESAPSEGGLAGETGCQLAQAQPEDEAAKAASDP